MSDPDANSAAMKADVLGGVLTGVSRHVATLGAIIAAVVGMNTALSTCATDRVNRYKSFRDAVALEETYWRGLYDSYEKTFSPEFADNPELRDAKRVAILQLTSHVVPSFEEFDVSNEAKASARAQFEGMQRNLRAVLGSAEASGEKVSEAAALQDFAAGEQSKVTSDPVVRAKEEQAVASQAASPPAASSLTTTVLSVAQPASWNVDVFWCQGSEEAARYVTASTIAGLLAERSKSGTELAQGMKIGRVRLRPLPVQINRQPGYSLVANVIRAETGFNEPAAANALLRLVNATQGTPFTIAPAGTRTPSYLSVFACDGADPAP